MSKILLLGGFIFLFIATGIDINAIMIMGAGHQMDSMRSAFFAVNFLPIIIFFGSIAAKLQGW